MSRIRYVKPSFFSDTQIADVSIEARLLYIGLWCHLDRGGVCEYDLKLIKREVFPYDEKVTLKKIESLLIELFKNRRLFKVDYESRTYIYCPYLVKHQKFHRDEKEKYKIPQEILDSCASTLPAPCQHPTSTLPAALVTGNGELVTGNGELVTAAAKLTAPDSSPESLIKLIPQETRDRWLALYGDDGFLKRELIKAHGYYVTDNPTKCPKSIRGWCTALSSWFERAWTWRAKNTQGQSQNWDEKKRQDLKDRLDKLLPTDGEPNDAA